MSKAKHNWLKGLLSGLFGGMVPATGAVILDPLYFNLSNWQDAQRVGLMALIGGVVNVISYLARSPLWDRDETKV